MIIVKPEATPVITPLVAPIPAMPGDAELHVPPDGVQVSVNVMVGQTASTPVMGPGIGFTVAIAVAEHPGVDAVA